MTDSTEDFIRWLHSLDHEPTLLECWVASDQSTRRLERETLATIAENKMIFKCLSAKEIRNGGYS